MDIFTEERYERALYFSADETDIIPVPLTRDGFEALLETVGERYDMPITDSARSMFAGYFHHGERNDNTTNIELLGRVLHKALSNALTWTIDQEIKQKRKAEEAKAYAEAQAEAEAPAMPGGIVVRPALELVDASEEDKA